MKKLNLMENGKLAKMSIPMEFLRIKFHLSYATSIATLVRAFAGVEDRYKR
jgi:hypothetical protein